jgi:oligopeptide transport system ATP-binding protein
MSSAPLLLEVNNLRVSYPGADTWLRKNAQPIHAVQDVSLTLREGETLGLVGESGCGKTTTAQAILRLIPNSGGRVRFMGEDITHHDRARMRPLRRKMQVVYQDPFGSLNPRMTAEALVTEPLVIHRMVDSTHALRGRAAELLDAVGLGVRFLDRYPHEFSGGQRQRLAIARALSLRPSLLLCDEPVSALDVSVQAQVLNLFLDLKERFGLAYLFVSHDLAVVRHISDRVAVMYLGRIVETAARNELYREPLHPYTKTLLAAVAEPDPELERARAHVAPKGEVPSVRRPPTGCPFHPRCPVAMAQCARDLPPLRQMPSGHVVACHLHVDGPVVEQKADV